MHDVDLSLRALRRAVNAIEQCREGDQERRVAHVLSLARLLRSDRVLNSAVGDLSLPGLDGDAVRIETIANEVAASAEHYLLQLAIEYQRATPGAEAWRKIVDDGPQHVVRSSTQETLRSLLNRTRIPGSGAQQRPEMTSKDLVAFGTDVIPKLEHAIGRTSSPMEMQATTAILAELKKLAEKTRRLRSFQLLAGSASIANIVRRFDALRTLWEQRLAQGPNNENWSIPDSDGLEHDASTIAAKIESFLEGRRSQRLVLYRAKVYFEHFFCEEARAAIVAEEARVEAAAAGGGTAQAQRELVLRRHLDRFIFQEGFFPVTEASASRGNLDLLLADADRIGIRPLVAEVKQAARIAPDTIGSNDVRAAIDSARAEIPRYAGHLRARPGWEAVEPVVVVFHTSIEDVSALEDEATILIDIGTRSPSRVRPLRATG